MYWEEFLTIAFAHLLAVASPGPDFAVVLRHCVQGGTRIGVYTAFGVGAGILLHVAYCLLGVALLLSRSPTLFTATKWLAAAYLLYLGVMALRSARLQHPADTEVDTAVSLQPRSAVVLGFLTNGLNPKATLFFLALFTVVIDPETPLSVQVFYGAYLALATFAWFALLSVILGRRRVRDFLLRSGVWFERGMGVVLILLAMQLLVSA